MAEIKWSEEAVRWLREIRDYIVQDDPSAADRTIDGIFESAQLLAKNPELGFRYPLPGRDDVRVLMYGHYRIAYVVDELGIVDVLGVFHGALDIDRFFAD